MLTQVEITNARGNSLQLPLLDSSAGYVVKDIEGLDPGKAILTSSMMAQVDGAQPQNARRDPRNITMKLGLEPDFVSNSVQSLRSGLYDYFMPKANIGLGFYIDGILYAVTSGQVESFDNSMFSADPEVDISIMCWDPDFYGPAAESVSGNTVSDTNVITVSYEGTSDAGVIFTLNINRSLPGGFDLYNTTPDNEIQVFSVSGAFSSGDVVVVTSIPGMRGIKRISGGNVYSVLYYVDPSSEWLMLKKGDNLFRAYAAGAAIPYTLTYTPQYGGL